MNAVWILTKISSRLTKLRILNKITSLGRSPNNKNSLYSKSLYAHESSSTLSRMTRDSFNKKSNLKEIILADSGSYLSLMKNSNINKQPLDQKLHLLQRESISRGITIKPPGTSGGRETFHFGADDNYQKLKYLPVSNKPNDF